MPSIATSLTLFAPGILLAAVQASSVPARSIQGEWSVKPLLRMQDPLPGSGGKLEQLDQVHGLDDGTVLFFGRFGPVQKTKFRLKENPWALYALSPDGGVQMGLRAGAPFAQDGGKDLVCQFYGPAEREDFLNATAMHVGRGMIYWSSKTTLFGNLDHVHGWDGKALVPVAQRGMKVRTRGGQDLVVEDVWVTGVTREGQAVLYFNAAKPNSRTSGYLLVAGKDLVDCWLEKEPAHASLETDRALEASLKAHLRDIKRFRDHEGYDQAALDGFVPLDASNQRILLSISLLKTEYVAGGFSGQLYVSGGNQILKRRPGIYLQEDGALTEIPFKPGGKALADLSDPFLKRGIRAVVNPIKVRRVPGMEGPLIEIPILPALGTANTWYFGPEPGTRDLTPPAVFHTAPEYHFTVAHIVAWAGPDRAVLRNAQGFFLLERKRAAPITPP